MGLPGTGRRRTPGLRREEVAALSGVGLTWYTWLEQGNYLYHCHIVFLNSLIFHIFYCGINAMRITLKCCG